MAKTYGPVLMKCPACGAEDYRIPVWVPAEKPLYKGDEIMRPEFCLGPDPRDGGESKCPARLLVVHKGIGKDLLPESFIVDVGDGPKRFSSLQEVRTFERNSEQAHRNGEGQIYNLREFSNDHRNRHQNSLEGSSYQKSKSRLPDRRSGSRKDLPIHVRTIRG